MGPGHLKMLCIDGYIYITQTCNLLAEEGLTPEEGNIEANERVFTIVIGPEHSGRVWTQGFSVTLTRFFPHSSTEEGGGSGSHFGQIASLKEEFKSFCDDQMREFGSSCGEMRLVAMTIHLMANSLLMSSSVNCDASRLLSRLKDVSDQRYFSNDDSTDESVFIQDDQNIKDHSTMSSIVQCDRTLISVYTNPIRTVHKIKCNSNKLKIGMIDRSSWMIFDAVVPYPLVALWEGSSSRRSRFFACFRRKQKEVRFSACFRRKQKEVRSSTYFRRKRKEVRFSAYFRWKQKESGFSASLESDHWSLLLINLIFKMRTVDRIHITPLLSMTTYYIMAHRNFNAIDLLFRYIEYLTSIRDPDHRRCPNLALGHIIAYVLETKYNLQYPVPPNVPPSFYSNNSCHVLHNTHLHLEPSIDVEGEEEEAAPEPVPEHVPAPAPLFLESPLDQHAENLNSFRFLLKQAENPDLLANDPPTENTDKMRDDERRR
ncbi:hypothetical protein IEQ34_008856 [Dendrobium chrysotoxum]|uniref:Uncharacterized protein n=1 Tax=Dendrobium chrysotoxum TaxID=161865 RepID=A0AAV7GX02_DENCH|nr:hypothetical protein IEQ34_008856 [Dendrobium chrysotoxum]